MFIKERPSVDSEFPAEEEILLSVETDIDEHGSFGKRWLVMTGTTIQLTASDGASIKEVDLADVKEARISEDIGGGSFIVDTEDGPRVFARFTARLSNKFSYAARFVSAYVKKEDLSKWSCVFSASLLRTAHR